MRTFVTMTWVEIKLLLREPAAVFFTLALPLILLALNGSSAQAQAPDDRFGGASLVDVMVPGFLLLVMATTGIMSLSETLAGYREHGILRRLRVSPLRPWQILGSTPRPTWRCR